MCCMWHLLTKELAFVMENWIELQGVRDWDISILCPYMSVCSNKVNYGNMVHVTDIGHRNSICYGELDWTYRNAEISLLCPCRSICGNWIVYGNVVYMTLIGHRNSTCYGKLDELTGSQKFRDCALAGIYWVIRLITVMWYIWHSMATEIAVLLLEQTHRSIVLLHNYIQLLRLQECLLQINHVFFFFCLPYLPWVFGQTSLSKQCRPWPDATKQGQHCLPHIQQFFWQSLKYIVKWTSSDFNPCHAE